MNVMRHMACMIVKKIKADTFASNKDKTNAIYETTYAQKKNCKKKRLGMISRNKHWGPQQVDVENSKWI